MHLRSFRKPTVGPFFINAPGETDRPPDTTLWSIHVSYAPRRRRYLETEGKTPVIAGLFTSDIWIGFLLFDFAFNEANERSHRGRLATFLFANRDVELLLDVQNQLNICQRVV